MLFMGLFVVVGAARARGHRSPAASACLHPLGLETIAGLSATAAILSNAISNVPAVMLFTRVVPHLPDPRRAWLALAMSSTLAGNLTILGFDRQPDRRGGREAPRRDDRFRDYATVGIPVTVATLVAGIWWLQ